MLNALLSVTIYLCNILTVGWTIFKQIIIVVLFFLTGISVFEFFFLSNSFVYQV